MKQIRAGMLGGEMERAPEAFPGLALFFSAFLPGDPKKESARLSYVLLMA